MFTRAEACAPRAQTYLPLKASADFFAEPPPLYIWRIPGKEHSSGPSGHLIFTLRLFERHHICRGNYSAVAGAGGNKRSFLRFPINLPGVVRVITAVLHVTASLPLYLSLSLFPVTSHMSTSEQGPRRTPGILIHNKLATVRAVGRSNTSRRNGNIMIEATSKTWPLEVLAARLRCNIKQTLEAVVLLRNGRGEEERGDISSLLKTLRLYHNVEVTTTTAFISLTLCFPAHVSVSLSVCVCAAPL